MAWPLGAFSLGCSHKVLCRRPPSCIRPASGYATVKWCSAATVTSMWESALSSERRRQLDGVLHDGKERVDTAFERRI